MTNHANLISSMRTKSDDQLRFIMSDAHDAINANPENPKCGHYQDEIHYAGMELKRRERAAKGALSDAVAVMRAEAVVDAVAEALGVDTGIISEVTFQRAVRAAVEAMARGA